jgi:hypothetical protein
MFATFATSLAVMPRLASVSYSNNYHLCSSSSINGQFLRKRWALLTVPAAVIGRAEIP